MTLAVLVGATILLLVLDTTGSLDGVFNFFEDPISGVMGWTTVRTEALVDTITGPDDIQDARAQIVSLQSQVDALQRENEQLREIEGEFRLLQDLFNRARESPEFQRLTASIIGYDTSPLFRSIILDKGANDGVHVGMPVESARGLVGQVYRTSGHSAMVILITDNISSIPARLGTSRATGIVRGGGLGGAMTMDWIDLESQIDVGEVVLTSGLGGRFPEDMVIGRIIEVERYEADLFQRATVQPAVDFDSLEMVFVITDFRDIDTSIFDSIPDDLSSGQ
ncbi:MAG TPA: rod shape-determining protein MreC [candidate division Zixibacteria bacterium]|nr:rod shape-determining protein MreC [candidate division Zixibacteria bacterium]